MKVLITSGGTTIPIDRVRKIINMSKGTFGSQICSSFIEKYKQEDNIFHNIDTLDITFLTHVYGKTPEGLRENYWNCEERYGIKFINFDTYDDYKKELFNLLDKEKFDIIILAAAVSDYGVDTNSFFDGKIRSTEDQMVIKLIKLPKLINFVREKQKDSIFVGFKLLVDSTEEQLKEACIKSINDNKLDLIVGNDLRDIKNNNHTLTLGITVGDNVIFEKYSKQEVEKEDKHLSDVLVNKIMEKYNE